MTIFSGRVVIESIQILFLLGIAMGFVALANLVLLYKLSLGKSKGGIYLVGLVFVEIFLLFYFSNNLVQFSVALITSSAALLWESIFLVDNE